MSPKDINRRAMRAIKHDFCLPHICLSSHHCFIADHQSIQITPTCLFPLRLWDQQLCFALSTTDNHVFSKQLYRLEFQLCETLEELRSKNNNVTTPPCCQLPETKNTVENTGVATSKAKVVTDLSIRSLSCLPDLQFGSKRRTLFLYTMVGCTSNTSENEDSKVHKPIKENELQKEVNLVHNATNTCKQDRTGQNGRCGHERA